MAGSGKFHAAKQVFLDELGNKVGPYDPLRLVWYAFSCGYWTDDWSKVVTSRRYTLRQGKVVLSAAGTGIPLCPCCRQPGMQALYSNFMESILAHDQLHPGYHEYMTRAKETCFAARGGLVKVLRDAGLV